MTRIERPLHPRRVAIAMALALSMLPGSAAYAQGAWPEPGTRVRVIVPCDAAAAPTSARCTLIGSTVRVEDQTLILALGDSTARVGLNAMTRLEVSEGTRSRRWLGAGTGFVVGAGATWLVLNSGGSTAPCDRDANQDAMSGGECLALTVAGGAVGAGLGAIVGGLFRSERWREVALERLRVGFRPGRGPVIGFVLSTNNSRHRD